MRQLKILEYALASLLRRKGKSFSLTLIYALTIAVLASVLLLTHALRIEAGRLLSNTPDLLVQRVLGGRHDLIPTSYQKQIAALPGVGRVEPRIWGYYYDALVGVNYTLQGVDAGATGLPLLNGRLPTGPDECAVGSGVAAARLLTIGDDLILIDGENLGVSYTVVGVFETDSDLLTHDLILFEPASLQQFFGYPPGMATDLAVEVYNRQEVDNIAHKVKRELPDVRPITYAEISRTYDAVFNWRSGMLLSMFALALFAFCVLAWDKATGLSAEEKREIGILKAVGWDTADVLLFKFWEGAVISLTAFLLGLTLAIIHVFWFDAPLLIMVMKGWSVLFPKFQLEPHVDLQQLFTLGFFTVVPYLVVTVVPSWRSATTDPDRVMRG
ncbi:MAG TPA: ABC transporter permease [Geothermobacteraceae bacterium]|nr:ABC transporter permease [Geothermobacteraceae bacterium]